MGSVRICASGLLYDLFRFYDFMQVRRLWIGEGVYDVDTARLERGQDEMSPFFLGLVETAATCIPPRVV